MAVVVLLFIAVLKQFGILEPMSMEGNVWPPAPLWLFPGRPGVGWKDSCIGSDAAPSWLRRAGSGTRRAERAQAKQTKPDYSVGIDGEMCRVTS